MPFTLLVMPEAEESIARLENFDPHRAARVRNALAKLEANPRHPGLNSHTYQGRTGPNKEPLFESYVENHTPSAYRLIWYYHTNLRQTITVIAVIAHPD